MSRFVRRRINVLSPEESRWRAMPDVIRKRVEWAVRRRESENAMRDRRPYRPPTAHEFLAELRAHPSFYIIATQ